MNIFSYLATFAKQLFEKPWDGAGSFFAMLKMPDKREHHLFAYGIAIIILGLMWLSMSQHIIHPLACGVLLIGTFFLFADEFGQFLHNKALIDAGAPPDRGITIWDIFAGWCAVFFVAVATELYFNKFALYERILDIIEALK